MKLLQRWQAARERLGLPAAVVVVSSLVLALFGLLVSASVDLAADKGTNYAATQASRLALAVPACFLAFLIRPRWIRKQSYLFLIVSILLLAAVLFVGRTINGSRRWLELGGVLRFQPSDLAKLAACLALARFCSLRARVESLSGVAAALLLAGIPSVLILAEPDLGTSLVFVPMVIAILFATGTKRSYLTLVLVGLVVGGAGLFTFGLHGYQRDRVDSWLKQGSMTAAEKQGTGYHLHRSMVAIGSGGFSGYGFAEGPQNQRDLLPERHTDFAFAVVSEEFGFLGATTVLLLELLLPLGLLVLALRVREPFAKLVIVGISAQIGSQAFINMGVATGLFPTTGIALPLVSYGGTSAVVTLVSLSIALNLAAHAEPVLAGEQFSEAEEETLLDRTIRPRPRLLRRVHRARSAK